MIDESCYPSRLAVHNKITSCLEQKCLSLEDKKKSLLSTIPHWSAGILEEAFKTSCCHKLSDTFRVYFYLQTSACAALFQEFTFIFRLKYGQGLESVQCDPVLAQS